MIRKRQGWLSEKRVIYYNEKNRQYILADLKLTKFRRPNHCAHSLLNEKSFKAALRDGIHDASKAITNTVALTRRKSPIFKFTGK